MKKRLIFIGLLLAGALAFYLSCGVFVIQPLGFAPEGATIVYLRAGTKLPFLASADGILLKQSGKITPIGRLTVFGAVAEAVVERKIVKLPYSRRLYLMTTGGREFGS